MISFQIVADSVKQVGFSQTGVTVNKKRVVGSGRICSNRQRSRMGKFIGRAYNISIKGKLIGRRGFIHRFLFGIDFIGYGKNNVDAGTKDFMKRVVQQRHVAAI